VHRRGVERPAYRAGLSSEQTVMAAEPWRWAGIIERFARWAHRSTGLWVRASMKLWRYLRSDVFSLTHYTTAAGKSQYLW